MPNVYPLESRLACTIALPYPFVTPVNDVVVFDETNLHGVGHVHAAIGKVTVKTV